MLTRRQGLGLAGGFAAALVLPGSAPAEEAAEIAMAGDRDGARVWFEPAGLLVAPGRTIRWVSRDPVNAHTATAYHPQNGGRPLRIPQAAKPWDSGYLLDGEAFEVTLAEEGVYDYFCLPHELAGMVGRIVVARAGAEPRDPPEAADGLPDAARAALPAVAEIMAKGAVGRR